MNAASLICKLGESENEYEQCKFKV